MVSLLDNHVLGAVSTWYSGANRTVGHRFTVNTPVDLDGIRYYAHVSSGQRPSALKLWKELTSTTGELLVSVPIVNNTPGVGWHTSLFTNDYPLETGVVYCVTAEVDNASQTTRFTSGPPAAAPYPLVWDSKPAVGLTSWGYPFAASGGTELWGVDVVTVAGSEGGSVGSGGEAPTNDTLTARLAQWLSSDPDTQVHETDGLPWLLRTGQLALQVGMDEAVGMLEALIALGIAVRFNDAEAIMAAMRAVVDEIALDSQATRDHVQTVGASGFPPLVDQIVEAVGTAPTDLRAPQDTVPLSDPGWVAVDTVLGSGSFLWDQPADRYVLTITAYAPTRSYNEVGTVPYWLHRGFWAVVDFDRVGHYYPIVGHKHMLYEVGSRLPGVLIGLDADIEWTLTAYDYTGEVGP